MPARYFVNTKNSATITYTIKIIERKVSKKIDLYPDTLYNNKGLHPEMYPSG